jgi:hypothetical protein
LKLTGLLRRVRSPELWVIPSHPRLAPPPAHYAPRDFSGGPRGTVSQRPCGVLAFCLLLSDRRNGDPWKSAASGAKLPFKRRVIETKHRRLQGRECHKSHGFDLSPSHRSGPRLIWATHIDGLERGCHERPGSLWVAFDYSQTTQGRMDLSKTPTRSVAALVARSKMAAGCTVWTSGQNTNRCANFVSVGTRFLGVLAEIAGMAETGSQTRTWIYAGFKGLSREKDWCCQTGLNCRPLHHQCKRFDDPLWTWG